MSRSAWVLCFLLLTACTSQVLQWLSFDKSSVFARCGSQARILMFYYWATFCILMSSHQRYLQVQPQKQQLTVAKVELKVEVATVLESAAA